jgi:Flp pilus assembly CpaE family ATPase
MTIYILNADNNARRGGLIESRLQEAIPALVKIERIQDVPKGRTGKAEERSCVVVILAPQDRTYVKALLDGSPQFNEQVFYILVGDEISGSEYKALLRTGRADWISATAEPKEILETIAGLPKAREEEAPNHKAVVATLAPSVGGAGNSTLAAEVGIHLSRSKAAGRRRVCIVDLDFQSSHICDYLDVEPRLQIQEISNNPDRLDAHLFDIFVSRHESGLHVFAAPRSKVDVCDLNVAALDRFFEMVSARYDLMLIDLPPTWFGWTSQIIFASDAILVTGLNTIPSLRQTAEMIAAVREVGQPDVKVAAVVNRCARNLIRGIARRRHVETLLGSERVFYVGEEPMATQSVNSGSPLALTNSYRTIRKDIAALATYLGDVKSLRAGAE